MYEPKRLHPAAIIDYIFRNIYGLIKGMLPFLIILIANPDGRKWTFFAFPVLLFLFIAFAVLYWMRYVFYIEGNELRIKYGVLVRQKRHIPLERIQTVQISAGVVQRMFGLVKLQVETAGGGDKAEVSLSALHKDQAEELRQVLQVGGAWEAADEEKKNIVEHKLSVRDLLIVASTSNGIGVVLSGLLLIFSQLDEFLSDLEIYKSLGSYAEGVLSSNMLIIAFLLIALLLVAWILSLLGSIVTLGRFQLVRDGDNLKVSRGLLERQQLTLPLKRIQAVRIVEGVLRQPLGFVSLEVITIGHAGKSGESNVLFPLIKRNEVISFLEEVAPEFVMDLQMNGLPLRARFRYFMINIIPALSLAVLITIFVPWGYFSFFLLPLAALLGNRQYKDAGWNLEGNKLILGARSLGKSTTIIPRRRIQSIEISHNFFQKRKMLSSLEVSTASSLGGSTVKLAGMDENESKHIMEWFRN